jgi:hypothetical protein
MSLEARFLLTFIKVGKAVFAVTSNLSFFTDLFFYCSLFKHFWSPLFLFINIS